MNIKVLICLGQIFYSFEDIKEFKRNEIVVMKNVFVLFFTFALGVNVGLLASKESRIYGEYEKKIEVILKKAGEEFKKSPHSQKTNDTYLEARDAISEARGKGLSHGQIENLKKMVYNAIKDKKALAGLFPWFEPTTEEELKKYKNMNIDDIFSFQD